VDTSTLTVEDCDENIVILYARYRVTSPEQIEKRQDLMNNIDSWLDTRSLVMKLSEKGGATVGSH
jgi:hypothetical protein